MTYTVRADPTGMACTVTATNAAHGYQLITTYLTDPHRDTVVDAHPARPATARQRALKRLRRLDAHVNGNGGGGTHNGGADNAGVVDPPPASRSSTTPTPSPRRPTATTRCRPSWRCEPTGLPGQASVGYAGTATDGLTQLDAPRAGARRTLGRRRAHRRDRRRHAARARRPFTLALGFGRTAGAGASAPPAPRCASRSPPPRQPTRRGWRAYDAALNAARGPGHPAQTAAGVLPRRQRAEGQRGQDLPRRDRRVARQPVGPGGQRRRPVGWQAGLLRLLPRGVLPRPVRGLHRAAGRRRPGHRPRCRPASSSTGSSWPTGKMPRNSLLNGKTAPDTGGNQLDETAYPILMAYLTGLAGDNALYPHIKPAADFLVAHGPSFGSSGGRSRAATRLDDRGRDRRAARPPPSRTHGDSRRARSGWRPPTSTSAASRAGR